MIYVLTTAKELADKKPTELAKLMNNHRAQKRSTGLADKQLQFNRCPRLHHLAH